MVSPVNPAVDPDPARGGLIQAGDHPHRGRLAGPVRAEEAGHDAGPDDEVQPVDRQLLPVPLTQVLYLDHRVFPRSVAPVTPRHATHARNHPPGPASAKRPQADQATYAARPIRPPPNGLQARPEVSTKAAGHVPQHPQPRGQENARPARPFQPARYGAARTAAAPRTAGGSRTRTAQPAPPRTRPPPPAGSSTTPQ